MRLHYYTTAVPNSYCVGVHNGHGFGSLFAKLFSKVAAKSAAKAAAKAAARVGRKAVKIVATKGAEVTKQAAKKAITKGAEAGAKLLTEKINSTVEKLADNKKIPQGILHSASDALKQGVKALESGVSSTAVRGVDDLVDKGVSKAEQIAGIKRREEQSSEEQKKKKRRKLETKKRYL